MPVEHDIRVSELQEAPPFVDMTSGPRGRERLTGVAGMLQRSPQLRAVTGAVLVPATAIGLNFIIEKVLNLPAQTPNEMVAYYGLLAFGAVAGAVLGAVVTIGLRNDR